MRRLLFTALTVAVAIAPQAATAQTRSALNEEAVDLCGGYVHGDFKSPSEVAAAGVGLGYVRAANLTQREDHMTGYEVIARPSAGIDVHVKYYAYPDENRSTCTVFLTGVADAEFRALARDYVDHTAFPYGYWGEWMESSGETHIKWERDHYESGSLVAIGTATGAVQVLSFRRSDPPDLSPADLRPY